MTLLEQLIRLAREILQLIKSFQRDSVVQQRKQEDEKVATNPADAFLDKFGPRLRPPIQDNSKPGTPAAPTNSTSSNSDIE